MRLSKPVKQILGLGIVCSALSAACSAPPAAIEESNASIDSEVASETDVSAVSPAKAESGLGYVSEKIVGEDDDGDAEDFSTVNRPDNMTAFSTNADFGRQARAKAIASGETTPYEELINQEVELLGSIPSCDLGTYPDIKGKIGEVSLKLIGYNRDAALKPEGDASNCFRIYTFEMEYAGRMFTLGVADKGNFSLRDGDRYATRLPITDAPQAIQDASATVFEHYMREPGSEVRDKADTRTMIVAEPTDTTTNLIFDWQGE